MTPNLNRLFSINYVAFKESWCSAIDSAGSAVDNLKPVSLTFDLITMRLTFLQTMIEY